MPDRPAVRRCVVVSPFFPPSGLPPAHRARLFVRHLPKFGWIPVVVTVDQRDREEPQEPALEATVSPDVRVEAVRALPASMTRRLGVGDLGLRALLSLARRAVRVAREVPGSIVLLVVPPWYVLWLAPVISAAGARVVVDYVDPWRVAAGAGIKSRLAAWLAARTEGACLKSTSGLFAVSDRIIADVVRRFPSTRDLPAGSAPYGFEESDLGLVAARTRAGVSGPLARGPIAEGGVRRLVYLGALSDSQRPVLAALLDALMALRQSDPPLAARIRLDLIGTTYAAPPRIEPRAADLVADRGLGDQVVEQPARVPYLDALSLMAAADGNLILGDLTTYYAASKLMPLLAARRPVLALLHGDSEPAALLTRLGARAVVCYGTEAVPSPNAAVHTLTSTLVDFVHGRIPIVDSDFAADGALVDRTAERMTGELAAVLDRVAEQARARS
jgi:hypothetical protein